VVALVGGRQHVAGAPLRLAEPSGMRNYRAYGVPWIKDDIHERLKEMSQEDMRLERGTGGGIFARWNGSLFYPSKTPDLIGVQDASTLMRRVRT
jgi:hypothetical protein